MAKKKTAQLGITKILKAEAPATYDADSKPLSEVAKLGSFEMEEATGEVLSEKITCMHPIPRVGTPRGPQEVGAPRLVVLSKPSDVKKRILAMLPNATSIHDLYGAPEDTDEDFNRFISEDTDEVDDFNQAMNQSPYYCDSEGMSNMEKAIAHNKEEAKELEHHMAMMQTPMFQEFMNLSEEQRQALFTQAKQVVQPKGSETAGGTQPEPEA